ncbi:MAG TPA: ABC transporter ATP-binding protein [Candidatus Limnocylindrales bacterium]|nr:ABC transporter ATP-binding protein [Candidatus Limnocylindrales bacterium]
MTKEARVVGPPPPPDVLLEVRNLRTHFRVLDGVVPAVDGVDFSLKRGETLGLVGESGCGKSVTSLSIMRLIQTPPGEIVSGEIWFDGRELLSLSDKDMEEIRGNDITMIFQEPMTSLNPVFTVGEQIAESVRLHRKASKRAAWDRATEMLRLVGIPSPERRVKQYPHELSGGMRQRVMIAMALACDPQLIIADEPTTALDVTIQAQILELIKRIQEETGTALLLITHDLAVVAETVERVAVMYAGKIVETGTVTETLLAPKHPYTEGLITSIPSRVEKGQRLNVIRGTVPNPFRMPKGCRFEPRCPYAFEPCKPFEPELEEIDKDRRVRCWLHVPADRQPVPIAGAVVAGAGSLSPGGNAGVAATAATAMTAGPAVTAAGGDR